MAILIQPDGTKTERKPAGVRFTLQELRDAIGGGYIEFVHVAGSILVVDEDGRSKGLPLNPAASALYGGVIVGPALLCSKSEVD